MRVHGLSAKQARRDRRVCQECGASVTGRKGLAAFCQASCRSSWNNRRKVRGAELYDLFMALRYERKAADKARAWWLLCRMAMEFRLQDEAERGGRASWRPPAETAARHGYLHGTRL